MSEPTKSSPSKIASLLKPNAIKLNIQATGKVDALREVASLLTQNKGVSNFEAFFHEILEREHVSNTALGHDVAIPHARTDQCTDIVMAVDEPAASTHCTPSQPLSCRNSEVRCLTHDLWEELGNQIYLYLRSVTIEDVIKQRVLAICGALPVDEAAAKPPAG